MFALLGSQIQAGAGQGGDWEIDAFRLGICTRLFNLWLLDLAHLSVWKASLFDWKLLSIWRRGGVRGIGTNTCCCTGLKGRGSSCQLPRALLGIGQWSSWGP